MDLPMITLAGGAAIWLACSSVTASIVRDNLRRKPGQRLSWAHVRWIASGPLFWIPILFEVAIRTGPRVREIKAEIADGRNAESGR